MVTQISGRIVQTNFVPVRPGLVITNPKRVPLTKELVELCKLNDWELVECAKPAHTQPPPLSFCSIWLSMNVLALDPKTVCVEEAEKEQMEQFDKLGFEVIPVPFWDVSAFGCGLRLRAGQLSSPVLTGIPHLHVIVG